MKKGNSNAPSIRAATSTSPPRNGPSTTGRWRHGKQREGRRDDRGSGLSELDAIEPNQLRALAQETIEFHLPAEQYEVLKAAEESERDIITRLVGEIARKRLR